MKRVKRLFNKRGNSYVGVTIFVMVMMMVLVFIMNVAPVFLLKMKIDTYAQELCREAEISGRIGSEVNTRLARLNESTGLSPNVNWSTSGKIQIGNTFTVTVSAQTDFSFFIFSGNPITIASTAEGTSEVFWK